LIFFGGIFIVRFLVESVRAVPTTALAAVAPLAQIMRRENVTPVFDVKINTFLEWCVGIHLGVEWLND